VSSEQPWAGRRLHLIGLAGAGMSGLALLARALGARVSGSDPNDSPYLGPVRAAGIEALVGPWDPVNVPAEAEVFYGTAVTADNPERAVARERGQPELHRSVLLGQLAARRKVLAVAGTHGKTTTASMAAVALRASGLEPGYLIGGTLGATGRNAEWGGGEWLVVEADESDRSLLVLSAEIAVLLNAELDHHATFGSRLEVDAVFREYLARARRAVITARPELVALAGATPVESVVAPQAQLDGDGARFTWRGHAVSLSVPGEHNASNAVAALEACRLAGADPAAAAAGLAGFRGSARRFERLGVAESGAQIYDDYAHHPTEVSATLRAARTLAPRRLVAVLQPHLFSRTRALAGDFGVALAEADVICVLDVYHARERAEDHPGVSGRLVAEAAADAAPGRTIAWLPVFADARRFLDSELRKGDLCVLLGAGDIDGLGRELVVGEAGGMA